jgi:uncharacterized protein DUF4154
VFQLVSNKGKPGTLTESPSSGGNPMALKIAVGCLLSLCFLGPLSSKVQAQSSEYQVKAAFLYNFAKFVEWPSDAFGGGNAQLVIGVVGDDPFGGALDQAINGKTVNGRALAVRRLKWGQDLRSCHVLFISASERKHLTQIIQSVKGASVLTVGDMGQFNQEGGIINFILAARQVRFEINSRGANQARLRISSKLMALAKNR